MPATGEERRNADGTPDVRAALDLDRYDEIARRADLLVNLWAALQLAAERGDDAIIQHHCKQIRIATRFVFETVKELGKEAGETPHA